MAGETEPGGPGGHEDEAGAPPGGPGGTQAAERPDDSWGEVAPDAARRLLLAAVEAFAERGFHATTTRDIASRAGMSPAALYIHYRTKEELLYQISRVGHERSVRVLTEADDSAAGAPGRLAAAVRAFVRWHAERHTTARVVQYELGALAEDHYAEIVALRRRSEEILRGILADGVATGEFTVEDIRGTALAVLSLCVDVARWFRSGGPRTPEEIGELYAGLVLRMVGHPPAGPAGGPGVQPDPARDPGAPGPGGTAS